MVAQENGHAYRVGDFSSILEEITEWNEVELRKGNTSPWFRFGHTETASFCCTKACGRHSASGRAWIRATKYHSGCKVADTRFGCVIEAPDDAGCK